MGVVKIIDLVGVSSSSFSDAVRQAVSEASKTIRGINTVDVVASSAKVENGQISEYHVTIRLAFPIERASD